MRHARDTLGIGRILAITTKDNESSMRLLGKLGFRFDRHDRDGKRGAAPVRERPMKRCGWARSPAMIEYHDREWGVPVHDDRVLFEFLILEGAQAGLSWETILKKRENYRERVRRLRPGEGRALHGRATARACCATRASSATG